MVNRTKDAMAIKMRLARANDAWNRFWFTPSDPTVLAAVRIITGAVALFTLIVYGFDLQDLVGRDAWMDLELRKEQYREAPVPNVPFEWPSGPARPDSAAANRAARHAGGAAGHRLLQKALWHRSA